MDRSRCSPGPPCSTRRRTASAPNAANAPPMYSPGRRRSRWAARRGHLEARRARPCLQRELGGCAIGIGTGPAEVGDGDDDHPRRVGQQPLRIDPELRRPRPSGGDDHDVGRGEFGTTSLRIQRAGQAALTRVEVAVQRRGLTLRNPRTGGGEPPQRISVQRFDFAHLGAGIDQELAAVAAGYPVADLDDT